MTATPYISGYFGRDAERLLGRKDPEAMKAVARELESLFAYEMIKAMRETTGGSGSRGLGGETYMGMFDMALSQLMAERGLGLQDMLLKGLERASQKGAAPAGKAIKESTGDKGRAMENITAATGMAGRDVPSVRDHDEADTENRPPVNGRVSSGFGMRRHPVYGERRFHHGVDISAPAGSAICPVKSGNVIFSGTQKGYGNVIIIDHGNGFASTYAHNSVNLVEEGDYVDEKTVIGLVGSTGASTGPHLHFGMRYYGKDIDPAMVIAMK